MYDKDLEKGYDQSFLNTKYKDQLDKKPPRLWKVPTFDVFKSFIVQELKARSLDTLIA